MIMPRGQQLLMPVRPAFIVMSIVIAFVWSLLPLGGFVWMPDLLMVVLAFWAMHQPQRLGMGVAFALGLCMDVQHTSMLGQHALAYVLVVFVAHRSRRRMMWFSPLMQALQVLPLFVAVHALQVLLRMLGGHMFPGLWVALAPLLEAVLWPLVSVLLLAPQRRAPDSDDNRPL